MKEYKDIIVYNIFEEEDEILDLLKADEYWKEDIENNVEDDRDYELVTNYLTNFFEDDVDKFRYKNGDEYLFCSIDVKDINGDYILLVLTTGYNDDGEYYNLLKGFLDMSDNSWVHEDKNDTWKFFKDNNEHDYYIAYRGGMGYTYTIYYKDSHKNQM